MSVPKPLPAFRKMVRDLVKTGEWSHVGHTMAGRAGLQHDNGALVEFPTALPDDWTSVRDLQTAAAVHTQYRPATLTQTRTRRTRTAPRAPREPEPIHVEGLWDRRARLIHGAEHSDQDRRSPILTAIREVEVDLALAGEHVEPYHAKKVTL